MLKKLFVLLPFLVSILYAQKPAEQSSDLIFNITHTKSKANVYKTIITFFEKNGKRFDCRLGNYKDFQKGGITVFSFYKCNKISKSYTCNIIISDKNVKLHFKLSAEKFQNHECINKTYNRWLELKDAIATRMNSIKDVPSSSIPPDVPAGSGFKNVPFGVSSDSVNALLDLTGYIEGGRQVSIHPRFHENYFTKDTTSGKKSFTLIVKLGEYISKVILDFTTDDKFYMFTITLPWKVAAYYKNVRDKDCLFLMNVFTTKYGNPDTTFNPGIQDLPPSANTLVGLWSKKGYEAYTAITPLKSKYCAVGIVKSRPLQEEQRKHTAREKQKKLKSASEKF
jgi:hypothetical protein